MDKVPMDFSSVEGKIITDPEEAESVLKGEDMRARVSAVFTRNIFFLSTLDKFPILDDSFQHVLSMAFTFSALRPSKFYKFQKFFAFARQRTVSSHCK